MTLDDITATTALERIDRYCDLAPRATADARVHGPFIVYVARTGWPFYARPRVERNVDEAIAPEQVRGVFARQRALGVPLRMEWIAERAPALYAAAEAAGAVCVRRPLLVRTASPRPYMPDGVTVTPLTPDDERFERARAAVSAGFAETDELAPEPMLETIRARAAEGNLRVCGAFGADGSVLGGGTGVPRGDVSELTGIAVPPRSRGHGIGAAITCVLADDAAAGGATTVWLSATDDAVARVYERAGFTRIGTSCEAELPVR